jgi:hypothetical protein
MYLYLIRALVAEEIQREQDKAQNQLDVGNTSDGELPDDTDDPENLLVRVCYSRFTCFNFNFNIIVSFAAVFLRVWQFLLTSCVFFA